MTDPTRSLAAVPRALLALALACSVAPVTGAAADLATAAEFAIVDTNDDGRISSGEHEVYARRIFDEIDTDADDKLTRAEIMANETKFIRHVFTTGNILGPAELSTAEKIQRLDANGDGVVSQTEHANAAAAKFIKLDLNNNGEVSPEEFDAGG